MSSIRNCSVCVVGGAGFLGSHMVEHLIDGRGCDVLVVDNLVAGRREFVNEEAAFEHADITGSESYLRKLFQQYEVEYVLNYASEPYVPTSFERPLHVFATNAVGALQVINAAQEAGCKGILQVSSAEIYGNGSETHDSFSDGNKIAENGIVAPRSSYGASKAAIDAMVQVRWRESQTPCIALRQFNCLGERDVLHPYVIPEIISQLSKQFQAVEFVECPTCAAKPGMPRLCNECLKRRKECSGKSSTVATVSLGNNSFRDFMYAGDAVRMAVELLESERWGEVFNLGSETGIKIYDLAEKIGRLMGFTSVTIRQDPARVRPYEIWHLQSDNTKIYATVKRRPMASFDDVLQRTIKSVLEEVG